MQQAAGNRKKNTFEESSRLIFLDTFNFTVINIWRFDFKKYYLSMHIQQQQSVLIFKLQDIYLIIPTIILTK